MQQINLTDATQHLAALIDAALHGEAVFITRNGQDVVQLVPVTLPKPHPRFGSAKGLIVVAEDFDDPLEDFKEYMG